MVLPSCLRGELGIIRERPTHAGTGDHRRANAPPMNWTGSTGCRSFIPSQNSDHACDTHGRVCISNIGGDFPAISPTRLAPTVTTVRISRNPGQVEIRFALRRGGRSWERFSDFDCLPSIQPLMHALFLIESRQALGIYGAQFPHDRQSVIRSGLQSGIAAAIEHPIHRQRPGLAHKALAREKVCPTQAAFERAVDKDQMRSWHAVVLKTKIVAACCDQAGTRR